MVTDIHRNVVTDREDTRDYSSFVSVLLIVCQRENVDLP